MLNSLSKEIHRNNVEKGFYDLENDLCNKVSESGSFSENEILSLKSSFTGKRLALVHSEVSEALEADRKGIYANLKGFMDHQDDLMFKINFEKTIKDSFEDEIADSIIRLLDLAGQKGIDLDLHVSAKLRYNKLRPYKHGKKY